MAKYPGGLPANVHREHIGDRIKDAREALGFDQHELAELLEISVATLSRWERGVNCPPADLLGLMTEKLGISAEWIVTGRGNMTPDVKGDSASEGGEQYYPFRMMSHKSTKAAIFRFLYRMTIENSEVWSRIEPQRQDDLLGLLLSLLHKASPDELSVMVRIFCAWIEQNENPK